MERVITVGLDGSSESLAAAHWAADEAEQRKLTLRLLHAWLLLVPEPTSIPSEVNQNCAGLLVVGRRKHRPPSAPRLGPVAEAAIHHARCPVAVVPHG